MTQLDELQALWQNQPDVAAREPDPAPLTRECHRIGRRYDRINIAKLILIGIVLARAIVIFRHSPFMLVSTSLILFFAIIALFAEWRIQRGIARLDFSAPSLDFVRDAITHIKAQSNPFHTREYIALFATILVGYNAITAASWHKLTVDRRITAHALATALAVAIYAFGRFVRAKRFNSDYRPLIERLSLLRDRLEERAW